MEPAALIGFLKGSQQFLKRLAAVVWLIGRIGFSSGRRPEEKFRLFFELAGGAFIKLGQILALRSDLLPPAYTEELLKLLAQVRPEPFSTLEQVFISDCGRRPSEFFKTFDPEPVASASISQVYRATLQSGEEVAVKIQRPGVRETFECDFILASFLAGLISLLGITKSVDVHEVVGEFILWTRRELDFRYEARHGAALYRHSLRHPDTVIPKVYLELSTGRVLITEYMRGIARLDSVIAKLAKNPNLPADLRRQYRIDLKQMAYYFMVDGMRQYFIDGFFHADPHPANVFLLPDNRLGYFDFGIMGEVGRERIELLKIIQGIAEHNLEIISRIFLAFSRQSFESEIELFHRHRQSDYVKYAKIIEKVEAIIADNFNRELEAILAPWYNRSAGQLHSIRERSAAVIFSKLLLKAEAYNVYLPREVTIFFRGLIIADMVAFKLYPDFDMIEALKIFFREFPLPRAIEIITERTHEAELLPQIDPVGQLDFEQLLEFKARERERLASAAERLSDLIAYYAERYEEVRKML